MATKRIEANVAEFILTAGPLTKDNGIVVRFRAREALSEMFRVVVDLASTNGDVVFEDMVGKPATLTILGADDYKRYFNGIVSRFELIGQTEERVEYRVEIAPKLWLLTMQTRCRIFQGKKTPTILKEVLTKGGLKGDEFVLPDEGGFSIRDYCVQYNESDFAFASRLMEEEGLLYYFTHTENGHVMEIGPPTIHEDIDGDAKVEFKDVFGGASHEEYVYRFTLSQEVRPGKVTIRDWDFEKPSHTTEENKEWELDKNLEMYSFPGEFVQNPDPDASDEFKDYGTRGKFWAQVRIQELNTRRIRGRGRSSCRRFLAGARWTMFKHPRDEANQQYTLVAVEHEGNQKDALGHGGGSKDSDIMYENMFEVIPATSVFRPPRLTPKPKILGTQTAVVSGPSSEEIHTDKFGRIKIKFPWDQSGTTENKTSCWCRVSHNLSGQGWGSIFIPRIGMEVLVTHLDADPDRPLVTGCVYNGEHGVPYPLPTEKTKSTIKSNSSKGGGGFNEFRLEDAKGSEEIFAHAQKDYNIVVENNRTKRVGVDETMNVGHDQVEEVKNNVTMTVGKDRVKDIKGNQTETVGGNHAIEVKGNQMETVYQDYTEEVKKGMQLLIRKAWVVEVTEEKNQKIGKDKNDDIGGAHNIKVGGALNQTVDKDATIQIKGNSSISITKDHSVAVTGGAALSIDKTADVSITKECNLHAKKLIVEADDEIVFKTGSAELQLKKDGTVKIKGKDITVEGTGNLKVKGSQTGIN